MDGGAWRAIIHVVPKSRTRLSDQQFDFHSATAASTAAAGPDVRAVTTWSRVSTEYFISSIMDPDLPRFGVRG